MTILALAFLGTGMTIRESTGQLKCVLTHHAYSFENPISKGKAGQGIPLQG